MKSKLTAIIVLLFFASCATVSDTARENFEQAIVEPNEHIGSFR